MTKTFAMGGGHYLGGRQLRSEAQIGTAPLPRPGDYLALLKPRVMSLVVFAGFAGLVMAPGHLHPLLATMALLCSV
jgi:protoheme IX farnesyltransferase